MSEVRDTLKYNPFQKESELFLGRCINESNKIQSSKGQNAIAQEIRYEWQKCFWEKPLQTWTKKMNLKIERLAIEIRISKNGRLGKKFPSIGEDFHNNL